MFGPTKSISYLHFKFIFNPVVIVKIKYTQTNFIELFDKISQK